jgi:hypothetical protein
MVESVDPYERYGGQTDRFERTQNDYPFLETTDCEAELRSHASE